jgi:hypothetical protein
MIDTSFEKILFENAPKDPVQQAAENADAANKASAQAHKDANKAQANSNAANNLAAEVLGLKQGATLKPADVLAKLKADPSILDKIAGNGNLLGLLKTSKENILALKNAPMLKPEETQQNNSESAQTNQGEAAPATNTEGQPENAETAPAAGGDNSSTIQGSTIDGTKKAVIDDLIRKAGQKNVSTDELITYLQQQK